MAIFKASQDFSSSVRDSACEVFRLPLNSGDFDVRSYSWGLVVEVFSGDSAGLYDAHKENGSWVFVSA